MLDAAHGMPTGAFSADECLAGREPNRGVELCTIVETAHSLGLLHRTHGDVEFADRAESIILNALPGAHSEDMWSHNYLSQPNEIYAGYTEPHTWVSDGPWSTQYGFVPNYACCTVNFGQGWPKHTLAMVSYRPGADSAAASIVVSMYGPLHATFPSTVGCGATLVMDTDYPFEDDVRLSINAACDVDVELRIPAWPGAASIRVGGLGATPLATGSFTTVRCPGGGCDIDLHFEPEVVVTPGWGAGGGASLSRGPLVFALPLEESWSLGARYAMKAADWDVSTNTSWNVALKLDSQRGASGMRLVRRSGGAPEDAAFTRAQPRLWLEAQARLLPAWGSSDGGATADALPPSPVDCRGDACGELFTVRLVPFGNTRLRIAVMPFTLE